MVHNDVADVEINNQIVSVDEISYIGFNELNPNINPDSSRDSINQIITNFWFSFSQILKNVNLQGPLSNEEKENFINHHWQNYIGDKKICEMYKLALKRLSKRIGKEIWELTENDVRQNIDVADIGTNGTFSGEISAIFKAYYLAYENNQYNIFQNSTRKTNFKTYTDSEFYEMYGPKPWDFVNAILKAAKLPYEVNNPEGTDRECTFHLVLENPVLGIEIQPSDLSTGEKVLMSLAMAIYNSAKKNIKNKVLLIDEPDAALHPQFSSFLLETLKTYIVKEANVKVIISTHSPTTVAMTDEEYIYEMNKEEKIPQKISKKKALSILCEGIPSLKVSIDKQRIVFVESLYDAENYHKIFDLIKKYRNYDIQPVFHAAYLHNGANCDDVKNLISKLENTIGVYGIIDFDNQAVSTDKIKVLGYGGELRYTIENYIFDPIFVGLEILRDNLVELKTSISYMEFKNCSSSEKQDFINMIISELELDGERESYTTISGETFSISKNWIKMKGHDLEAKILDKWPRFNKIKKNNGDNAIKSALLDTVIRDYAEYLSEDFDKLFCNLI